MAVHAVTDRQQGTPSARRESAKSRFPTRRAMPPRAALTSLDSMQLSRRHPFALWVGALVLALMVREERALADPASSSTAVGGVFATNMSAIGPRVMCPVEPSVWVDGTSERLRAVLLAGESSSCRVQSPSNRFEVKVSVNGRRPSPPPTRATLHELTYRVRSGDSWKEVARLHGVDPVQLREWNPAARGGMTPGVELSVWVGEKFEREPLTGLGHDRDPSGLNLIQVARNGTSRGYASRGRLQHGVPLPENRRLYTIRRPEFAFGSSHMVWNLQLAIAKFRAASEYAGPLVISDLSRQYGGPLQPHRSHQSGRDVDIWLPLNRQALAARGRGEGADSANVWELSARNAHEIDWDASFALVQALVRTGEVRYIFLSRSRQRHLYRAARGADIPESVLADVIEYPERASCAIVRDAPQHHRHIHVRFRCAPDEVDCL